MAWFRKSGRRGSYWSEKKKNPTKYQLIYNRCVGGMRLWVCFSLYFLIENNESF